MPLSEEELRMLAQMERALVQDDPRLANTLRGTAHRRSARRRAYLGLAAFVAGVALLMTGAVTELTLLGIAGFLVMLGAATVAMTAWREQSQATDETEQSDEDV